MVTGVWRSGKYFGPLRSLRREYFCQRQLAVHNLVLVLHKRKGYPARVARNICSLAESSLGVVESDTFDNLSSQRGAYKAAFE